MNANSIIATHMRSDNRKYPAIKHCVPLTFDDLKNLSGHAYLIDIHGNIANVKITSVKSWKRRPNDLDIHCKYGLYEYFTVYVRDQKPDMTFVTILPDEVS